MTIGASNVDAAEIPSIPGAGVVGGSDDPGQALPSSRRRGLALAFASVLVLGPDALIIRLIDESPGTLLFARGFLGALSLAGWIALTRSGSLIAALRAVGRAGLAIAVCQGAGSTFFVTAVTHTSAANALVIIGTGPLFAAIISRLVIAEPIPRRTWLAVVTVTIAVAVLFAGSLGSGDLVGDLAALGGAVSTAAAITIIRRSRATNMLPAMALGSVVSGVAGIVLGASAPQLSSMGLLVVQGSILIPTAVALVSAAPRHLPAPEVSLIARLEMILGPIWVWWGIGEAPTPRALVSGLVIIAALTIHSVAALRAARSDLEAGPT